MTDRVKHMVVTVVMAVFVLSMALWCLLKSDDAYSAAERRPLEQAPEVSVQAILSGKFMTEFEDYALDQFPARDELRQLKALSAKYLYGQRDNNGLYLADGHLSKLEYPLDEESVARATRVFTGVYDRYLTGTDCQSYLAVIPDKNYFLAGENGYPELDYAALVEGMRSGADFASYIDLFPLLTAADYYTTDSHWRQERLLPVAQRIAEAMGASVGSEFELRTAARPFYGVYYGQAALPVAGEDFYWLTNAVLEGCTVYDHENGREISMYDLAATEGDDPYQLFLYGSLSLITIENPAAATDRELILFRDSFGSSIAPLLVEGYSKVTLVDIRYLASARLGDFIEFDDQDVLFLYSAAVLNNSETLK